MVTRTASLHITIIPGVVKQPPQASPVGQEGPEPWQEVFPLLPGGEAGEVLRPGRVVDQDEEEGQSGQTGVEGHEVHHLQLDLAN